MRKKILITGGVGFVGGRLAKKLSENFEVIVSSRNILNEDVKKLHGINKGVLHSDLLKAEYFPENIFAVIHLAALNEWDCVKYPSEAIRVNIDETRIILENSIKTGVTRFIYFSTAHIYQSPLIGTIDEDTLTFPAHPYAITHKAAEDYIIAAALQKKMQSVVIRLSNSFGAPISPAVNRWTLLANDLSKQAVENKKLKLLSNGCQYRDFVCLTDVANCIEKIVSSDSDKFKKIVYNLGSGVAVKVIDMATMIIDIYKDLFGETIPLELPVNVIPTEESSLHFSIDRLLSEGVVIKNDFKKELTELLLFCNRNFKNND